MRSLQEWHAYVESQAEAARKKRGGKEAPSTSNGDAVEPAGPSRNGHGADESAPVQASERSVAAVAVGKTIPEGRALLTWETTSPNADPPDAQNAPHSTLSDRMPADPTGTLTQETESPSEVVERQLEARAHEPLQPYESKDPRWRSSVDPPRTRQDGLPRFSDPTRPRIHPRALKGSSPPTISLPLDAGARDGVPADGATMEPVRSDGGDPSAGLLDSRAPSAIEAAAPNRTVGDPLDTALNAGSDETVEAHSAAKQPVKRSRRITSKEAAACALAPPESAEEVQALWERVPRHVQALIRTQSDEVARRSYKKGFKETREDLIHRLLDPELSLEESARILGVCPTTVRRYTNRGLLPHHRTTGNQRRFRLSHVLEFMERFGKALQHEDDDSGLFDAQGPIA